MTKKLFNPSILFGSPFVIILFFSFIKLFIHFIFNDGYGIFRDELYYVACGNHLAFGYVDQPPFVSLVAKITTLFLGKSLFALRFFPALAGASLVFITGLIIKEISDEKYALIFGLLAVTFSPVLLGITGILSMNVFDILFCTLMVYFILLIIVRNERKYWIWLGIIAGIGLLNKLSPLFIGFGLFIGLLVSVHKRQLLNKNLWLTVFIAFIIFLPNIIWQAINDFPTLEFMNNAATYKNAVISPQQFLTAHLLDLHPNNVILLISFISILFSKKFGEYKIFVWIYISILLLFLFTNAKPYYIAILNPMIIAFGSVVFIDFILKHFKNWVLITIIIIQFPFFVATMPFALPVLEVKNYIAYSQFMGITPESGERSELGVLPQHFADRFGWEEMAKKVSDVYLSLPESERKNAAVFGQNYGEAGAIDFFRDKYPLPHAISGHNNYWLWGYPANSNDSVLIVIGSSIEDNSEFFEEVTEAAIHYNAYGMPYENVSIFICRKPKMSLKKLWTLIKMYI